jgi:DNA-binding NtrC family response regulator
VQNHPEVHDAEHVRELRNAIERAILLCHGGLITREHLPVRTTQDPDKSHDLSSWLDPAASLPPGGIDFEAIERVLLEKALRQAKGNKTVAARLLGLTRAKLYSRLEKHTPSE